MLRPKKKLKAEPMYNIVRAGLNERQFCRFSGQQSSLFLEAGHTSTLAVEDNAQSRTVGFSPYDFGQAKRLSSRAVNGNWKKGESISGVRRDARVPWRPFIGPTRSSR